MKVLSRTITIKSSRHIILLHIDSYTLANGSINLADIIHPVADRTVLAEGEYKLIIGPTETIDVLED